MLKAEMRFLRAVAEYTMTDHKCNANIRRELGITETNAVKRMMKRTG
jgi:hypothetical protein